MNFNELYIDTCPTASKLAAIGDVENLKKLVSIGKPTNGEDNKGWRALHHACNGGHLECIDILLKADDVDINATSFERQTALYLTCCSELSHNLKVDVAKLLLKASADPNYANQNQYVSILNQAVSSNNLQLAKLLLKFKVNVNETDGKYGSTLNAAVETENLKMVELITKQRLDFGFNFGPSVEKYIVKFFHMAVLQKNTEILKHLVKNPQSRTKIDARDEYDRTSLLLACLKQYREGIEILLDHGADPNLKSYDGDLPILHLAQNLEDEDFHSPDSLLGRMIKMTNKRELMRPKNCSVSFFHQFPFFKKSVQIYDFLFEHFHDLSISGSSVIVLESFDNEAIVRQDQFQITPLVYYCEQERDHKNYEIFYKMVEHDININGNINKFPVLRAALLGGKDLHVIEHLLRNGACFWTGLGDTRSYTLQHLIWSSERSAVLELVFSLVVPPDFLIEYDYIFEAETSLERIVAMNNVNFIYRYLKAFFNTLCNVSKYSDTKFFKEFYIQKIRTIIDTNISIMRSDANVNSDELKEVEELYRAFLTYSRTPRSLLRLASLRIRDILYKCTASSRIPLFERIDALYNEVELPVILKGELYLSR